MPLQTAGKHLGYGDSPSYSSQGHCAVYSSTTHTSSTSKAFKSSKKIAKGQLHSENLLIWGASRGHTPKPALLERYQSYSHSTRSPGAIFHLL